jgi:hypothetical protein
MPVPGAHLIRPVPLAALVVLAVNDHVLKAAYPGWITGKLSDLAGMVFFPFFLEGLVDLARAIAPGPPRVRDGRVLLVCTLATGIVFGAVKTIPVANLAYRVGLGALGWGPRALFALLRGAHVPPLGRVSLVRDPTDLVALVGLGWPLFEARRAWRRVKSGTSRAIL